MRCVPRLKSCAIIQMEAVHEEIIPSLIHALNKAGFTPHVYINAKCKESRGEFFGQFPQLSFDVHHIRLDRAQDWQILKEKIRGKSYQFALLSTFQRDGICNWSKELELPIIGVVHNANAFINSPACLNTFKSERARLLFLSDHVGSYFHLKTQGLGLDNTRILEPVYWGASKLSRLDAANFRKRRVGIPGGINFKTRNLDQLLPAIKRLMDPNANIEFIVLGGGPDKSKLIKQSRELGLDHIIKFSTSQNDDSPQRVPYCDYFSSLRTIDLILPMNPLSFSPYREHKITSAIFTAVGFRIPLITDYWTSRVYRPPSIQTNGEVSSFVKACIEASDTQLLVEKKRITRYRRQRLIENSKQLADLISSL